MPDDVFTTSKEQWAHAVKAVGVLAPPLSAARIEDFLEAQCSSRCLDNVTERKIVASQLAEWIAANDPVRPLAEAMAPTFAHVVAFCMTPDPFLDVIEVGCESHSLDGDTVAELTGIDVTTVQKWRGGESP